VIALYTDVYAIDWRPVVLGSAQLKFRSRKLTVVRGGSLAGYRQLRTGRRLAWLRTVPRTLEAIKRLRTRSAAVRYWRDFSLSAYERDLVTNKRV